jgi:hypothetical protein
MVAATYFGHVDVGDRHFKKLGLTIAIGRESVVCLVAEPGHEGPRPFPWLTRCDKNVYLRAYSRQQKSAASRSTELGVGGIDSARNGPLRIGMPRQRTKLAISALPVGHAC